jgi:hydroxypyruvate isomerase
MESFQTFQSRVQDWMVACFGTTIPRDKTERSHRFIEESIELAQALGCSKSHVIELVEYVYSRPIGAASQEIGGTLVTLAALCSANDEELAALGEAELLRVWQNIETIRKKRERKLVGSVLP